MIRMLLGRSRGVRWMRDPTRGGLAMSLNELLRGRPMTIEIEEERLPVRPSVRALCEILGIDPLYVACEGRVVVLVAPEGAAEALAALRAHPTGSEAVEVGSVTEERSGRLVLRTSAGGRRVLDPPSGEQLPRIC
jgi:hydrogenase expression/formation protein HypE